MVLVYSVFRWRTNRQAAVGSAIVLSQWLVSVTTDFPGAGDAVGGMVVLLLPAALGVLVRYRRIVRAQPFERVRFHERELLARELHATVAHHVSAIAIQAQAGQFLAGAGDLDGAAKALDVIEEEASRTLTEMRVMVGSLRRSDGTPQVLAQRGVADLDGLATGGPRVDVEHRGDLDDLRPSVRAGLTTILDGQPDIDVVGQAADGREAVALARRLRPDVCLFDVRMPNLDGVEATRLLAGPGVDDPLAVVVITTFDTDEHVSGALRAGARGFLLKDAGPALLVQAIHAAAEGDALIAPSVTARLLAGFADSATSAQRARPLVALTDREEEVALTVAQGRTNAEIAEELHISLSTVKFHLASLMNKIGARNRVQIAIWAYETRRVRP